MFDDLDWLVNASRGFVNISCGFFIFSSRRRAEVRKSNRRRILVVVLRRVNYFLDRETHTGKTDCRMFACRPWFKTEAHACCWRQQLNINFLLRCRGELIAYWLSAEKFISAHRVYSLLSTSNRIMKGDKQRRWAAR